MTELERIEQMPIGYLTLPEIAQHIASRKALDYYLLITENGMVTNVTPDMLRHVATMLNLEADRRDMGKE